MHLSSSRRCGLLLLGRLSRLLSLGGLGLLLGRSLAGGLGVSTIRRCPEGEVVAEELHDQGGVALRFLRQRVELGDGVVEGLLSQMAGAIGRVQDLVVEDREVQCQTKTDGVGRGELSLSNIRGRLRCHH